MTENYVFQSEAMLSTVNIAKNVAKFSIPILITGESGVGKEVIADVIHEHSKYSNGNFVKLNCAGFQESLIESELFGSIKGSYTDAKTDKPGLIAEAGSGTLLLDEIGEIPFAMQAKLLRVLQDKVYRPVGATKTLSMNCRVIASTNINIGEAINTGKFRKDLFYRISGSTICIPSLKDRLEDIIPLAELFITKFAAENNMPVKALTPSAKLSLLAYSWPGNVRQLYNEVVGAFILSNEVITENQFAFYDSSHTQVSAAPELSAIHRQRKTLIISTLEANDGNVLACAKALGLGRQTLYNYILKYNITRAVRKGQKLIPTQMPDNVVPIQPRQSSEVVDGPLSNGSPATIYA